MLPAVEMTFVSIGKKAAASLCRIVGLDEPVLTMYDEIRPQALNGRA
jgi:hypothetical protein